MSDTPLLREDGTPMPVFTPVGVESGVRLKFIHVAEPDNGQRFQAMIKTGEGFADGKMLSVPSPWFCEESEKDDAITKMLDLVTAVIREEFFTPRQP